MKITREEAKRKFGRRLHAQLKIKGWSQSDLSRYVSESCKEKPLSRQNVSFYVRGVSLPGIVHLEAIARVFGLSPNVLLPSRGQRQILREKKSVRIIQLDNGRAWLQIEHETSWNTAVRVIKLLKQKNSDN